MSESTAHSAFDGLTHDRVINQVETTLGVHGTNLCRPFNSYINRVYEVELNDGSFVVIKFFRPGRWSHDTLLDEQDFLLDLKEVDVPVIAPLTDEEGNSLHQADGLYFSIFPKLGGRICDELNQEQWIEVGRLLGRVHQVGSEYIAEHRITMSPSESAQANLQELLQSESLIREHRNEFEDVVQDLLSSISPLFDPDDFIRIHGDLHAQNLIYRPGEGFFMIDFDDMAMGSPVQDMWMLLPGRYADTRWEMKCFLEGYTLFTDFAHSQLRLIEPLRAMRFLHFEAWCARQAADGGFQRLAEGFGTSAYWQNEIAAFIRQKQEIANSLREFESDFFG